MRLVGEFNSVALRLVNEGQERSIEKIRSHLRVMVRRIEGALDDLNEVEEFFQPGTLTSICRVATEQDNPKKRIYEPGIMSITCRRDKSRATVHAPKTMKVPDRKAIEAFREALSKLG